MKSQVLEFSVKDVSIRMRDIDPAYLLVIVSGVVLRLVAMLLGV